MSGNIRTKEVCPKCGDKFTGAPLACPACQIQPQRYYIDLYHKKKLKIYSDKQGHPLDSYHRAHRELEAIRYEIDQHMFDPKKYMAKDLKACRFEAMIEKWYQSKMKEVEKGNLAESYTSKLRLYIDSYYMPYFKGQDVRDIKTYHVDLFYQQMPAKSLKYIKNILNGLENFFKTVKRLDLITQVPTFPIITLDRKTPRWVNFETQVQILGAIPEEDRPIFFFLSLQGTRPAEARALKVKDINFIESSITIQRTYSMGKLRERVKSKVVMPRLINPALLPILREACTDKHPEAFVFTSPRTNKPYSDVILFRIWDKVRTKLNIDLTLYQGTRHSLASIAASNGAALTAIKDVLGHTDIRTTMKYAHTDLSSQMAVFSKKGEVSDLRPQTGPKRQPA